MEGEKFTIGDRGFSHYTMMWGTVETNPDDQGWFYVRNYDGTKILLNDERFNSEAVAIRYGYGEYPE